MSYEPDGRGRRRPGDEYDQPSSRDGRGPPRDIGYHAPQNRDRYNDDRSANDGSGFRRAGMRDEDTVTERRVHNRVDERPAGGFGNQNRSNERDDGSRSYHSRGGQWRDKSQDRQYAANPRFEPKGDHGGGDVRRDTRNSSPPPGGRNGGRDMDDRRGNGFGNDHRYGGARGDDQGARRSYQQDDRFDNHRGNRDERDDRAYPPRRNDNYGNSSYGPPRSHYDDNRGNQGFDSRRNEGGSFGGDNRGGGFSKKQDYGGRNEDYGRSNGGYGNDNRYNDRNGRFDDRGGNRGFDRNGGGGGGGFPQNDNRGGGGGFNQYDRGSNSSGGGYNQNGGGSGFQQNDTRGGGRGFNQNDQGFSSGGGGFNRNGGGYNSGGGFNSGGGSGFHQNDNRDGGRGFNQNDRGSNSGGGRFGQNDNRGGGGGFDRNSEFKSGGGSGFDNRDSGFGNGNDNYGGSRFNNDGGFENRQQGPELGKERAPREWMPEVLSVEEMTRQIADNAQDLKIEEDQRLEIRNSDISQELSSWENSGLHPIIQQNVARCGYKSVRAIQAAVIPQLMAGYDLLGQAETGGGKTAAFALPIIHKIMEIPEEERERAGTECSPYCFILSPVRELAKQTSEVLNSYAEGTGVKVQLTYGEMNRWDCLSKIRQGCHILVGTCGRIMDYLEKGEITFSNLRFFVLDEADRLLEDMTRGSGGHLETIVNNRKFQESTGTRQTLLFSATFNSIVEGVARNMMRPLPGQTDIVRIVLAQGRINPRVHLHFIETNDVRDKMVKLKELTARTGDRYPRTLIFVEQKKRTDYVAIEFEKSDVKAESINGDRPQNIREQILKRFRTGETDVLIGTDVCSRGLDIPDLERVINYDLPKASVESATDTFIHRVGRCGRLKRGDAYSFVNPDFDNDRQLIPALVELVKTLKREDTLPDFMKDAGSSYRPSNNFTSTGNMQSGFSTSSGFGSSGFGTGGGFGSGGGGGGFGSGGGGGGFGANSDLKSSSGFGSNGGTTLGSTGFGGGNKLKGTKDEDEEDDGEEKKENNDDGNGESARDDKKDDEDEESEW